MSSDSNEMKSSEKSPGKTTLYGCERRTTYLSLSPSSYGLIIEKKEMLDLAHVFQEQERDVLVICKSVM